MITYTLIIYTRYWST